MFMQSRAFIHMQTPCTHRRTYVHTYTQIHTAIFTHNTRAYVHKCTDMTPCRGTEIHKKAQGRKEFGTQRSTGRPSDEKI